MNNKVYLENRTESILKKLKEVFLEKDCDQNKLKNILSELDQYLSYQEVKLIKTNITAVCGGALILGEHVQNLSKWLTQLNNGIALYKMSSEYFFDFRKKYKFYYNLSLSGEDLIVKFYAYDKNDVCLSEIEIKIINKNGQKAFTKNQKK